MTTIIKKTYYERNKASILLKQKKIRDDKKKKKADNEYKDTDEEINFGVAAWLKTDLVLVELFGDPEDIERLNAKLLAVQISELEWEAKKSPVKVLTKSAKQWQIIKADPVKLKKHKCSSHISLLRTSLIGQMSEEDLNTHLKQAKETYMRKE